MEPILKENPNRFVLFPIHNDAVWQMYKKAEASFWTAEEIDLSQDLKDWENLNDGERHFINHVLAFFTCTEGVADERLSVNFFLEVQLNGTRSRVKGFLQNLRFDSFIRQSLRGCFDLI
ncbi:hypothetical protein DXT99_14105 [Pontibacter diazotrophicus]|uniref:Uncharacterized protein n=1 Tax=Pontibacter diazotrophicus TaxID=1400979 RepID=A0A3D8LAX1_9BACT|nr:hypothetical protein DXT99_14105 [Pontibacter diazotrophicus]